MFKAPYIPILLIALVVQCPFHCLLGGCLGGTTDEASTCCCRCEVPADESEDSTPAAPSDCSCGDCFCRGALLVDEYSQDIVTAGVITFLTSWSTLELTPAASPISQVRRHSNVLAIDASALEVRAALCCWLI